MKVLLNRSEVVDLINQLDKTKVNNLTPHDKRVINKLVDEFTKDSFKTHYECNDLNSAKAAFTERTVTKTKKGFFSRLFNKILKLFGLRVGSAKLNDKVEQAKAQNAVKTSNVQLIDVELPHIVNWFVANLNINEPEARKYLLDLDTEELKWLDDNIFLWEAGNNSGLQGIEVIISGHAERNHLPTENIADKVYNAWKNKGLGAG